MVDATPDGRRGIYSDAALWQVRYDGAIESERFWRNFAALEVFGRSDLLPPFDDELQVELDPLMKRHWVSRTLEQVPWQVRDRLGIPLEEWRQGKRTRKSAALVIPMQRTSSPIQNNRGGRP